MLIKSKPKKVGAKVKTSTQGLDRAAVALLLVLVGLLVFRFFFFRSVVVGESMAKTLNSGEVVWVRNTEISELDKGSVIVFDNPFGEMMDAWYNVGRWTDFQEPVKYLKRIVGVPGDDVTYSADHVVINGEELYRRDYNTVEGQEVKQTIIPDNHYFVLGDNRDHSLDSRMFGPIHKDAIVGEMIQSEEELSAFNANYPKRPFEEALGIEL